MAKVSIIVPIYNVEKYLKKCLESLINQTFKDIEIWAISDGSPDNSVSIIKEYEKKDSRVKCIEKENGGYGSVLEYAIKNITTPYFLICDPDDWLREDAIEKLYNAAIENNLDFVRGSFYNVYSNDMEEVYQDGCVYPHMFKPKSNKVYDYDTEKFLFMSDSPHSKLFKTELAKNIEFPHKVSFTDGILYKLYVCKMKRSMFIDEPLSYYLMDREGNTVTDVKPKIADQHYTVFMSIMEQYKKYENKSNWFYYRNFLQCEFVNFELAKIKDKKVYKEKRKLLYDMYKECRKYKNEIYECLKTELPKKKVVYKLLLNSLTAKITFLYFSNKVWSDRNKNI
ncbi:MAG: glycosyltransferase family 2 protein [Clostridia bacterium]|nr:glycosyltransferase family 2 protein [Clostridia bacterium]